MVCHHRFGCASRRLNLLVSLSSRARTSKNFGLTVLLAFNSRRRLGFFLNLLYTESPSPEMEKAERVNALPFGSYNLTPVRHTGYLRWIPLGLIVHAVPKRL